MALAACVQALQDGRVVAVKGVGGYHLMCDAASSAAVAYLRERKPRPHKPLALMCPDTAELAVLRDVVLLSADEEQLLRSPARPIVLAQRRPGCRVAEEVAPGLGVVGVMLPYSPLHHLLLNACGTALVATSANLSGEPVMTDAASVEQRLGGVAQAFLHHNRPIVRPADDPVYRTIRGRARPLRIGRGNAPLELRLPVELDRPVLAVGGHMKNTVCLAWGARAVVSPHIGDMGTARSLEVFEQLVADLQSLYGVRAEALICDRHPGYATTRWAQRQRLPCVEVQHHAAHAAALVGEQAGDSAPGDWLVFTWDGVGYGSDGELWGGEAVHGAVGGRGEGQRGRAAHRGRRVVDHVRVDDRINRGGAVGAEIHDRHPRSCGDGSVARPNDAMPEVEARPTDARHPGGDVDLFPGHSGQLGSENELIFVLADVDPAQWQPQFAGEAFGDRQCLLTEVTSGLFE